MGAAIPICLVAASFLRGEALATPALRVAGQIGGPAVAAAIAGDIALAGAGYRLILYDISDPTRPREVGALAFGDAVRAIAVAGTRAYVAAGASGLHIIDVADASKPSIIASWNSPGSSEGVAVKGANVYLADGPFGLEILDVTAPQNPRIIGNAYDDFFAFDVALSGDVALIAAADAGLLVADVSDPRSPKEIGSLDTPGYARGVAVTGARAVIADQWEGVRLIDVADPHNPRETGALATRSWAMDVAADETTAFIATGSAGLLTVDVTNPTAPRELGSIPIAVGDAVSVAVSGQRAVVAAGRMGLHVIDTTTASAPRVLGVVAPLGSAVGVALASPYAYVTGTPWLTVIDVSTPAKPREIAAFGTNETTRASNFVVHNNGVVYVGLTGGTLLAVDVTDPARPVETARISLDGIIYAAILRDNVLFAAAERIFAIIDVSDARKPVMRSKITMSAEGVALRGTFAFVGEREAGLAIIDVANPAAPSVVGHYRPAELVGPIAGAGDYVYIAFCDRIDILDVTTPTAPKPAGSVPLRACTNGSMKVIGDRLYVPTSDTLLEIDVSKPSAPAVVSSTALPVVLDIADDGNLVAVGAGRAGLFLLDRNTTTAPVHGETIRAEPPLDERWVFATAVSPSHSNDIRGATTLAPRAAVPAAKQIVVSSTANDGDGTLRHAMTSATDGDVITFDTAVFPPQNPAVIRFTTPLGSCVPKGVTIDASNAGVVLDGSELEGGSNGINICSDRSVVMGLQVINFPGSGFEIFGGADSRIGGDRTRGVGPTGEGNLISGNVWVGIGTKPDTRRNRIVGNVIGVAPAGRALKYQQQHGIFIQNPENVIGGTTAAERNLISGTVQGVILGATTASHNVVAGNYIGTDATGTAIMPTQIASSSQGGVGIITGSDNLVIDNVIAAAFAVIVSDPGASYNRVLRNRIGIAANGERVTGTLPRIGGGIFAQWPYNLIADNVISGFPSTAIVVRAGENFVMRNLVGTDTSGIKSIPNDGGVLVSTQRAFIGGRTAAERNIISGNNRAGIELRGLTTTQNFIVGNTIGASVYGAPLGNTGAGIQFSSSQQNLVQRNTITGNRVGVSSGAGSRNRIRRNSIFGNTGAGLQDDSSAQPPPAPVITEVGVEYVKGSACIGCIVEVFSDGEDEGAWFEGETVAASNGQFTMRKSGGILRGPRVSATATDLSGATSVFSAAAQTPLPPPRRRAVHR